MKYKFTIRDAFSEGVQKTKKYWKVMLGIMAVTWGGSIIFDSINNSLLGNRYDEPSILAIALSVIVTLLSMAFSVWTGYNLIKMLLKMTHGHETKIKEIIHFDKKELTKMGYWFLGLALYSVLVFIGLILLIIPGIYFMMKYSFVPYLMIEKDLGIKAAFLESGRITKGQIWHLTGLTLVSALVFIAGLMLFVVGAVPAYMLIVFANMYVYKKLSTHETN